MFKCCFRYLAIIATAMFACSCSNRNNKPIIKFSEDSSSIIIKNIDQASLLKVKNTLQSNTEAAKLISVLVKPGELDSIQDEIELSGNTKVIGDSIVFSPEKYFEKGKKYLVENYIGIKFAGIGNLLNSTAKRNLQPQKQILTR